MKREASSPSAPSLISHNVAIGVEVECAVVVVIVVVVFLLNSEM